MMYTWIVYYILIFLISHAHTQLTPVKSNEKLYQEGQQSYDKLNPSKGSKAGSSCMTGAFSQLNATCATLDDEIALSFLALKFTQCHFQASQRPLTQACSDISKINESITNCTKGMSENAFLVYTDFYTHTRSSCYYIEEKLWQEKTDNTISMLSQVAEESADKMQESLDNNKILLKGQGKILDKASQLNKQQDSMQEKLNENHSKMDLLSKEIGEFYTMVTDLFSTVSVSLLRLEQMVKMVLGETQQLSSFLFYITFIISTFILTFPMRTSRARMKILGATMLHFLFEKLFFTLIYSLVPEYSNNVMGMLYYTRFIIVLLSLFILLHTGYHYNDYEKLLMSIGTKLDRERIENEKFREDIRKEMQLNTSSLHEKSNKFSTPSKPDSRQKFPNSRHSIHRHRKRFDSNQTSSNPNTDYNPLPDTCQSSDVDSGLVVEPLEFTPMAMTSLDYDSGVEDCVARKELQISLPKFDLSTYHSPRSSPYHETPIRPTPSRHDSRAESPYNLRARK